jgi:hypothetical protein
MRIQDTCGDCGVAIGMRHHPGCDVTRCPECGRQALSCDEHCDTVPSTCVWTGYFPGCLECEELGWFREFIPDFSIGSFCTADDQYADPDLNGLMDAVNSGLLAWDRGRERFVVDVPRSILEEWRARYVKNERKPHEHDLL